MNLPANLSQNKTPSLQAQREHREWIGGRAFTLLSHYWRDDDSEELTQAMGADWADVLEGIPQQYIQTACVQYQRDEPRRKPTPGAIYQIAKSLMPAPSVAWVNPNQSDTPITPMQDRVTPDRMSQIIAEAGLDMNPARMPKPKRF